jgi:hypothetical protein
MNAPPTCPIGCVLLRLRRADATPRPDRFRSLSPYLDLVRRPDLVRHECGVAALPAHQFIVAATFHDPAAVEDENQVRVVDRAQPVGDDDLGGPQPR